MWRCASRHAELVALWLALVSTAQAAAPDRIELLALRLNGVEPAGAPGVVAVRRGADGPALDRATWAALGLREPTRPGAPVPSWLALDTAALAWRIDTPTQTLMIDAPASAFRGHDLSLTSPAAEAMTLGRGVFANYEGLWQPAAQGQAARGSAWLELHGFGAHGAWRHTALVQHDQGGTRTQRLETSWVLEDPAQRQTLQLGDTLLQPGSWGRALRVGGLRWSSDFTLTPGFVAFPTPTLQGEATLPSTVELYVDGVRRLAQGVAAGPFEIGGLPLPTGQGELRLVVRDLLGRERVVQMPYHTHAALLRPGLVAHSVEVGAERLDYGRASGRYGAPVAAATRREGLSERWTQEWRAEATRSQLTAGTAATWLWQDLATLQGQLVLSHGARRADGHSGTAAGAPPSPSPEGHGAMLALQAEHQSRDWAASVQARTHSPGFRQLGQGDGAAARWQASASAGTRWAGWSLALNLLRQQPRQAEGRQLVGAQLSRQLGAWGQLGLALLHDRGGAGTVAALHLHLPLGERSALSAGWTQRRPSAEGSGGGDASSAQLWWQQSPPDGPGWGGRLGLEQQQLGDGPAQPTRQTAELLWQGERVDFEAGVARIGRRTLTRLGARGAVGMVDGHAFASRRIDGSVAVVQVGELPGIGVRVDRRLAGRTDADGRVVVTGLRPHERQRIEVDADELPAAVEAQGLQREILVPGRGGLTVALPLRRSRTLRLQLRRADGGVPAPGSRIEIEGRVAEPGDVVGFEGRVFLARVGSGHDGSGAALRLTVHDSGAAACRLDLPLPDAADTDLGERRCH